MRSTWRSIAMAAALSAVAATAGATELTLHLEGTQPLKHEIVRYTCDAQGAKMGLPAGTFSVEYINGAGNHLAILPIHGRSLIFANVSAGSGARYASAEYIWWDAAGRDVSLSSDSLAGKFRSECHRVPTK